MCEMMKKVELIQEQSQLCGEFLEFLMNKYAMFEIEKNNGEEYVFVGSGDYIDIEKVLAEFFDIDLEQYHKEQKELLASIMKD